MFEKDNRISFEYKGFIFRKIHQTEIRDYFNLRHRIFCKELGWVPENDQELETDRYDNGHCCKNFGAFCRSGKLVGCLRMVLPSSIGWMIHNEFRPFFGKAPVPNCTDDAVELTRLGIDKNVRDNNSAHILSGLFKLTYKWSLKNNINKWYFVTNKKYILLFKRLEFPVHIIGDGLKDNNNISIVPAVINLKEGARVIEKVNIEQYNFYHDYMQKESAN